MTFSENAAAGAPWAVVALIQLTLVALLGLAAWLLARRGGPALRGAVLLAGLVGLLLTPVAALVAPVWLPLPEYVCPSAGTTHGTRGINEAATSPVPRPSSLVSGKGKSAEIVVVLSQPPAKTQILDDPARQANDTTPVKTEPVVINFPVSPDEVEVVAPLAAPTPAPGTDWGQIAGTLAVVWLFGTLVCLIRALARLALLYRCAGRARPVRDPEWIACVESLAQRHGMPAVTLRESPVVGSPLTLGLFTPVILLPLSRRDWSDDQRRLILGHELTHVRRRDFLAGLVSELVLCLCWFHPLARWLAGRLRLEQEYAADAWVAAAAGDSSDYVRCLARLALERSRGQSSLAPAFWRRRPEILRRIDMLRRNPRGLPSRLGKRAGWTVAALGAAACLAIAGVGPLQSANSPKPAENTPQAEGNTGDQHGDPLPDGAVARLGTVRLRHGGDVTFVAFGPDGKTLLTAGQDGTIRLWDLGSRKEVRRFTRPRPIAPKPLQKLEENVRIEAVMQMMAGAGTDSGSFNVALSPDGKTVAAAAGGLIQLWEAGTGKELRQILPPGAMSGLLFSPDGKLLAARSPTGAIFLWATDTGKELHQIKPLRRQNRDGVFMLTLGGGGGADAPGMAFAPDSKALVAAVSDYVKEEAVRSIKFWDVATGKETRKFKMPEGATGSSVALSQDGKLMAYGAGNSVRICAPETGKETQHLKTDGGTLALVFTPDGKTLAVRGRNQRVRLWDTATGKERHQLSEAEAHQRSGGFAIVADDYAAPEVRALAISADGKQVASASGSTIRLWETATGKELSMIDAHWRAPTTVLLSPDGKMAVSWGGDRMIRRWESATGKVLGAFPAPPRTTVAAFSPDARAVALANADNTIRIHDTASGKEIQRLKGHQNGVSALAFAPGGKVLASRGSGDSTIRLQDVTRGVGLRDISISPPRQAGEGGAVLIIGGGGRGGRGTGPGLAFSPDGKLIVVPVGGGGDRSKMLVLFDVTTGKELRRIDSALGITSFAFAPDGRTIAAENTDRTITLWEVVSGKERGLLGQAIADPTRRTDAAMQLAFTIDGISGSVSEPGGPVGITYSPDGRALAVRGTDRSVHIWDVSAGKEIGQLRGHGGRVETVAFASDGKTLASGAADTTVLVWDAAGPLKALAKQRETQLSPTEVRAHWDDLASEDAAKAFRGVRGMALARGPAVLLLNERLKPAARVDPQKLNGWIADLESEKFAVRQEAISNLLKVGEQALPALQKVLGSGPQLETRKRVEELVNRLTGGTLTTEQLRLVRAVEALELIATPEARRLLQTLADGAPGTLPTREARAALDRLGQ